MATVLAFLTLSLSLFLLPASGSPSGLVVKCTSGQTNCTVTNAYDAFPDRSSCREAAVTYPTNKHELLLAVSNASLVKQHMKVVTTYAHSIPKLSCPGGPSGIGLAISTERLDKSVHIDVASSRLTVEVGITLPALLDVAAANGLTVPHLPYWQGVTLGGLLGTGSHGSSMFGKGSAVHEYVIGMRLVVPSPVQIDGLYARVAVLGEDDPDLLAAKVSLGILGVVSQVTLQLEPLPTGSEETRLLSRPSLHLPSPCNMETLFGTPHKP